MDYNFQEMVDRGEPIYVINRSARKLGKAHLLVLEFPHPSGGRGSTVQIPPIKYPINLTSRVAPPSAIPLSTAFINWVHQGVLEVVSADKAKEILADPEARAAVEAAYTKLSRRRGDALNRKDHKFVVRDGGARETHAVADLETSNLTAADFYANKPGAFQTEAYEDENNYMVPEEVRPAPQRELSVKAETVKLNPKIEQFCADLLEDGELRHDYLIEMKGWDEETLTDDEIGYMLQQLNKFDGICAYLRQIKADRAGGGTTESGGRKKRGKRRGNQLADLGDE